MREKYENGKGKQNISNFNPENKRETAMIYYNR